MNRNIFKEEIASFINKLSSNRDMLTKEEAISFVLYCSKDHKVTSTTKLQKATARMLKYFIPLDFEFNLNRYGSDCEEIRHTQSNEFYERSDYNHSGRECSSFSLKDEGLKVAEKVATYKLTKMLSSTEIQELRSEISKITDMGATEASDNEHKLLLVDEEHREKLIMRINDVNLRLFDLYEEIKDKKAETSAEMALYGLIEYAYYLSKFIREKRFKNIDEKGYDFEADMRDYYYLYNLNELIPIIEENMENPDEELLDGYFKKFLHLSESGYPFSLDNKNLLEIIK